MKSTALIATIAVLAAAGSTTLLAADRDTARRHAGDASEADLIYEAWIHLRSALAEAGFAPR